MKQIFHDPSITEQNIRSVVVFGSSEKVESNQDTNDGSDNEEGEVTTQSGDEPLTFLGLTPKRELDSLDNGLVFLGPILIAVQLLVMYEMIFGSEIPITFGGPPPLPPSV